MKKSLLISAFFGMILAACLFSACKDDKPDTSAVFLPTERPYDKSYTDWTVLWMQQFLTNNCADNPFNNPSKALFYKTGPVYMLAGISANGGSADITVPNNVSILLTMFNYINDYPCPDAAFQPAAGQSMQEFLKQGAVDAASNVSTVSVEIDGVSVPDAKNYLFTSELFYFTGNPDLANCVDPCITGASQPGVTSGYYVMIKPLSKGQHTVHYHTDIPNWNSVQDGSYRITVQ